MLCEKCQDRSEYDYLYERAVCDLGHYCGIEYCKKYCRCYECDVCFGCSGCHNRYENKIIQEMFPEIKEIDENDIYMQRIEEKIMKNIHKKNKISKDKFTKIYPKRDDFENKHYITLIRPKNDKFIYLRRLDRVMYNYKSYYICSIDRNHTKDSIKMIIC